jgi:hypothetical protein
VQKWTLCKNLDALLALGRPADGGAGKRAGGGKSEIGAKLEGNAQCSEPTDGSSCTGVSTVLLTVVRNLAKSYVEVSCCELVIIEWDEINLLSNIFVKSFLEIQSTL